MEKAGVWKDWKDVRPVCVKLTMLLDRRLDCGVRKHALSVVMTVEAGRVRGGMAKVGIVFSLSEPTSLLVEWVSWWVGR
jgi:hypothetical protein